MHIFQVEHKKMHFSAPGQKERKEPNNEGIIIKDFVKKGIQNHIKLPLKLVSMENEFFISVNLHKIHFLMTFRYQKFISGL